jgi:hypothetical protein
MLGVYGFEGDLKQASHFLYKLSTNQRVARTDTNEYVACCKEKDCGYGYVSALIYGDGEYATGEETQASGKASVVVATADGSVNLHVLHRRKVKGWLAAVVTVTRSHDANASAALGPLGVASATGLTENSTPDVVKTVYLPQKLFIADEAGETDYVIREGRKPANGNSALTGLWGAHKETENAITENEFVRRFRKVTGSTELDDLERNRHSWRTYLVVASVGTALAGTGTWEFATLPPYSGNGSNKSVFGEKVALGTLGLATGIPLMVAGGVGLVISAKKPDGAPRDHYLTAGEARVLVERYNRALLRKTIQLVEDSSRENAIRSPQFPPDARSARTVIAPVVSPSFLGLAGTF